MQESTEEWPDLTVLAYRYTYLVHHGTELLSYFDIGQLKTIGSIAAKLPSNDFSVCYPFSFADLHLSSYPVLSKGFNAASPTLQCRIIDVCRELGKEGDCKALVAIDYDQELSSLLSLGKDGVTLKARARFFLTNPLTQALLDDRTEAGRTKLLGKALTALEHDATQVQDFSFCLYPVTCCEQFFVQYLFCLEADIPFTLDWGPQRDSFGRLVPTYLSTTNVWSPE